jgi:hypothetical protein
MIERRRPDLVFIAALISALSDQVESPDRKEFAPIQKLGAWPCRKSGSTFPGHALASTARQSVVTLFGER